MTFRFNKDLIFRVASLALLTPMLICSIPQVGAAQNEFTIIKDSLIEDDFISTEPKKVYTAKYLIDGVQNSITAIHLNPMNPCTGGVCIPGTSIEPEERDVPLEALIPGSIVGKVDGLYSETLVESLDVNISAPLILQMVSLFLAEPAVAQGVTNAKMEAAAHHHSMMLDDIRTKQLSELFPGSENFVKAYVNCVQEEMVENRRSMVEAKVVCQQDRNWNSMDPSTGTATGFLFSHMPGWDPLSANPLEITLTDIIFNPENGVIPGTRINQVRDDFKDVFGNIRYTLEPDLANSQVGSGGTWIPRLAHYEYEDSDLSPSFYYYKKLHSKFDLLRWIVARHCNYRNDSTLGIFPAVTPQAKSFWEAFLITPATGVFYGTDLPVPMPDGTLISQGEDALKKLSLPGLAMNPTFFRPIFAKIINGSWLPRDITSRGEKLRCDELETPLTPAILETSPTMLQEWIDDEIKPQHGGAVPGIYTEMLFIARRLALGEFLVEASMAEQIIKHLSSGIGAGMKLDMLNEGLKLIYRTVGTEDIKGSLDQTLAELRSFLGRQVMELDDMNEQNRERGAQIGSPR